MTGLLYPRPEWFSDASCRGADNRKFFPERGEPLADARAFCVVCPVKAECLQYALVNHLTTGIWGGMSERQRRRLRLGGVERPCLRCNTLFVALAAHRYCSAECREAAHNEQKKAKRAIGRTDWASIIKTLPAGKWETVAEVTTRRRAEEIYRHFHRQYGIKARTQKVDEGRYAVYALREAA